MSILSSVLWFVVAVGVLVTVHEFGHFWVARRVGVKVLRFSVGFGRPLWMRRAGRDQTEYVIATIPLGGYVKMLDEAEGEVAEHELGRAFNRQPLWKRFAVVFAGPLFNFLFAIAAYWLTFVIGIGGLKPVIGSVEASGRAAEAGLVAGQEILRVDGRRTHTWQGVVEAVIGATLDDEGLRMEVAAPGEAPRSIRLDLGGAGVDELGRGQFFDALGITPDRPVIAPVIGRVEAGSPAAEGGLEEGDRVLEVDGKPVETWATFVELVRSKPEQSISIAVERDGARRTLTVHPAAVPGEDGEIGRIGAGPMAASYEEYYATERYGPLTALTRGVAKTWRMTVLTLKMLWKMLVGEVSMKHLSGPISIAQYAGFSAEIGVTRFLDFLAIVSISLGILNLLPIPILDGGHLMYYFVELVRGRPVSEEAQFVGQRLGIAMLIGLMGLAFYNDLARLFG